jgi:hypothetical protein
LLFLLYINDLPNTIADPLKLVLFADDTSVVIANLSPSKFKDDINDIIDDINDWFKSNSLSLNFDKTYFVQFRPKNRYETNLKITCGNKLIKESKNNKFLGLNVGSSLSWRDHIEQMMFKRGRARSAVRYVKRFMSQDTLRTIYFSYFHSILSCAIIFWCNSAYSSDIFKIQKKDNYNNYECQKWKFLSSVIQEFKNFTTKITIYFFPFIICCKK